MERLDGTLWHRCTFRQWDKRKLAKLWADDAPSQYINAVVEFRVVLLKPQKPFCPLLHTDERPVKESQRDPGPR